MAKAYAAMTSGQCPTWVNRVVGPVQPCPLLPQRILQKRRYVPITKLSQSAFLGSFEAAARLLAIDPVNMPVRTDDEIETAIAGLGPEQAGVVVTADSFMAVHFGTVIFLDDSPQRASDLRGARTCQGRRFNLIRGGLRGHFPPRSQLCGSHPARPETS